MKTINSMSQLKKELQKGTRFLVIDHWKPELIGQQREVNVVQTNCVYTVIVDNPNHEGSTCNGGRGSRMEYNKANHYEFSDTIKWFKLPIGIKDNEMIMEFKLA